MITAILPSHNEQETLPAAIASLRAQTVPVDKILVVSDNSTDRTVQTAIEHEAWVMTTVGNADRKAGALNQALATVKDGLVLVMDADTEVAPGFVEAALAELEDPQVGGVGAVFTGVETSLLELCQINEWHRYKREVGRTGRVWVLSGTAALIRTKALHEVRQARTEGRLPGSGFYDVNAATEDMELSVALKTLGWRLRSPLACESTTELMPTILALWRQRLRWYGGALDCIRDHGLNRATWRYVGQQFMLGLSVAALWALAILTVAYAVLGVAAVSPFWLAVGGIFWAERVITVPGLRRRLWAALLLPELAYAVMLQGCWVVALGRHLGRRRIEWTHLEVAA